MIFDAPQIGRPARLRYVSTKRDGQFGRAERHSRTIGAGGSSRETSGVNLRSR